MAVSDPRAVAARIRSKIPELTPLEVRVINMMMNYENFSETTPLKEIAQYADVSEAMIVKMAKKMDFEGFRDIRAGLAEYNRSDTASLHAELSPEDSSAQIVEKVFRTSMQAMEETLAILDIEAFEKAAVALNQARHRDFYGIGGSAQIARDAAHKFLRIGLRAAVHDDAHMMLMSASVLESNDVVLAFSHSGNTTAVLEPLELARNNGARTIAVTNYANSCIADLADYVLCSTAQGSPLLGENAAARIAQLNILDALFASVAQLDRVRAEKHLNKTMDAVSSKRKH